MAHTRKKRSHTQSVIAPGPRVCHPRLGRSDLCLPESILKEVAVSIGSPTALSGQPLRQWMTRKTRCKTERCWIERSKINPQKKAVLIKRYFRPTMPDDWVNDPDEWLDSNNIDDVMKQYEEAYPEFKYFGSNPIDFSAPDPYNENNAKQGKCLNESICKLRLSEWMKQGKTKLGFIYNLDPSNKGGSHWIASFTDIPGHKTYYFDSYGIKAPPQIARFMRSMTLQDPKMKLAYNARRFQYGDTECGIYSLYFLIRMIEGDSFQGFCRKAPKDEEVMRLRKWLFSPKSE